ncbi:UDP-N-acetylmuramoyl-L-alanyl-D-glutamate--2,6-diaminopimelate ligase [Marinibactrum halimedae]|uniref:UDP-N-acetylmuramoyl-L-alanyl-D-glutamate--2,6-diaminopimelate ligase n=1 Tax=Marinibactrum halimedae TaxID=1444977 RepID=A0AA37WP36_9GAMM|nr:UDP-N-acetylmuramoyl-L-alanyl-D-glutamate--2,6-diaminopimelate ligase [Marinibactrum halimedae]MCD9459600.1 UDP-N-acetylmuramoyl-L-alanyl-D-glutamate--2,6-diaminopimelate ligase [Marinibactrum halimedae]GLS25582.1 UDP-N-acetylmuramoyl-L-alanyl-D-glutamate--2,6-diaminopimelate ligase [Marinibactrum halimedae]
MNAALSLSYRPLQALFTESLPELAGVLQVNQLVSDSRCVQPGAVFVALPGLKVDGRDFISQAVSAGAVAVLSEVPKGESLAVVQHSDYVEIQYPALSQRLSAIAARFYGNPVADLSGSGQQNGFRMFAVTGTNGKTTCSQLYSTLQQALGMPCGVIGTIGYGMAGQPAVETGFTTPDAITSQALVRELIDQGANVVSVEASSHSLAQHRLDGMPISTALFTNLTRDHLDYHGDMNTYGDAKARLFMLPSVRHAVINVDDRFGASLANMLSAVGQLDKVVRFSIVDDAAVSASTEKTDVRVKAARFTDQGITAELMTPWGNGQLVTKLIGPFNLSNLVGVIASLVCDGADFHHVMSLIPSLKPVSGRMQVLNHELSSASKGLSEKRLPGVVVDYAHTPDALAQALKAIRVHTEGKLWCVFGCGGDRDTGKRPQMGKIASELADHVVITNDNPRSESPEVIAQDIESGVINSSVQLKIELNRAKAIEEAIRQANEKDIVLIAGKGHETYQEVAGVRTHFNDVEVATQVMNALSSRFANGSQSHD